MLTTENFFSRTEASSCSIFNISSLWNSILDSMWQIEEVERRRSLLNNLFSICYFKYFQYCTVCQWWAWKDVREVGVVNFWDLASSQNCPQVNSWLTHRTCFSQMETFLFISLISLLTFRRVMGVLTSADSGTLILYSSFSKTGRWSFMSPRRTCSCL